MKNYRIESEFEHKGLKCVVIMTPMAHRCGYVGIEEKHPLYKKPYTDYLEIKKKDIEDREVSGIMPLLFSALDDNEKTRIDAYFQVHGGITYANGGKGSKYPIESDLWWFGFDCAHYGDGKDFETAKKLFSDDQEKLDYIGHFEKMYENLPDGDICTKEYVENECRHLAEQLAEFGGDTT